MKQTLMLNSTRDDMDSTAYTSTWKEGMQTQSSTFLTQRVPPESDPTTPRTPRGLLTSRRMVSKPNIYLWYPDDVPKESSLICSVLHKMSP